MILSNYKIEETFKYNSIDWKISFKISLDSFLLTLYKIPYYNYQNNYDYYYLSTLFQNKNNIKEIIDLILDLIKKRKYKIEEGENINLILILNDNENIKLKLFKNDKNIKEVIDILIKEITEIKKEKDLILNELKIMKEINYNENIDINSKIIKLKENKYENKDNYMECIYDVKDINKETQIINYLNVEKKKKIKKIFK